MNNRILHGLEFELQLMIEDEEGLRVVSAENYLHRRYDLLPQCTSFDFGNIEISTPAMESYKEAVNTANYILTDKLVPALINDFKLEKFALFLPTPMCKFYYNEEPTYIIRNRKRMYAGSKIQIIRPNEAVTCLKHWNISINIDPDVCERESSMKAFLEIPNYHNFKDYLDKFMKKYWPYNYESLLSKGYQVMIKDLEIPYDGRVHIKIPYHYTPINSNPDLLPNFEDIIIPPDRGWKNLVSYYKNGIYTQVRNLI